MQFCSRRLLWSAKTMTARRGRAGSGREERKSKCKGGCLAVLPHPVGGWGRKEREGWEGNLGNGRKCKEGYLKG